MRTSAKLHAANVCFCLTLAIGSLARPACAEIITRLPTTTKVVALTFDACEQEKPRKLDRRISDYLVANKIPFTIFMGGRFARDNADAVKDLSLLRFVEIENHSWSHPDHMPRLLDASVVSKVVRADHEINDITGRRSVFFRFPAGNYDKRTLAIVEGLGYRVVHWRWAVGDPDPAVSANQIVRKTLTKTAPGDILVFHINGGGVHTGEALPRIIDGLRREGYQFVTLETYLKPNRPLGRVEE